MTYGALIIINQKRSGKIIQHIKLAKINVITPRIIIGLIFILPVKLLQKNPFVKYNNITPSNALIDNTVYKAFVGRKIAKTKGIKIKNRINSVI